MNFHINPNNPQLLGLATTKKMIMSALLELMKTHSFSDITITHLCDFAQVGRKTYYRHFDSKHDIIIQYLDLLIEDAMIYMNQRLPSTLEDLLTAYFEFWQQHDQLIKLLRSHQLCYLMIFVSEKYFEQRDKLESHRHLDFLKSMSTPTTLFIFSGATRIVQKWIYDDFPLTASEMAEQLHHSLKSIM